MSASPAIVETREAAPSAARATQPGAPTQADAALFQLLVSNASTGDKSAAPQAETQTPTATATLASAPPPVQQNATPAQPQIQPQAQAQATPTPQPTDPNAVLGALMLQADTPAPAPVTQPAPAPVVAESPTQPVAVIQTANSQIVDGQTIDGQINKPTPAPAAPEAAPAVEAAVTPQLAPTPVPAKAAQKHVAETKPAAVTPSEPDSPPDAPAKDVVLTANAPASTVVVAALVAPPAQSQQLQTTAVNSDVASEDLPIESASLGGKKAAGPIGAPQSAQADKPSQPNASTQSGVQPAIAQTAQTATTTPATVDATLLQTTSATTATATPDATAAQLTSRASVQSPAAMAVAQQIVRRFDGQSTTMNVRLDPPELGKVEVRLNVDRDKRVTAKIAADNPQALNELRANARELERALSDAGLTVTPDGLSFDLADQRQAQAQVDAGAGGKGLNDNDTEEDSIPAPVAIRPFGLERWNSGGVDVWA